MTINLSNGYFKTNTISILCAHDKLGFCVVIEINNGITINFKTNNKSQLKEEICYIIKFYGYATSIYFTNFDVKNWT